MASLETIKKNEKSVLETFQKEIPSVYYSDKSKEDFKKYKENSEYMYRHLFKFPPKMFEGQKLIDFGAGTGENTVYLANWGAKCTLVEMNELAQKISKDVFKKYTNNYEEHKFILSSIFDYKDDKSHETYDIVHCRGVLAHTADKENAFSIISKFLKPGGYLIFGDPNKAGGFQNMLQRYLVYSFANDWQSMIKVSEDFFKEDIDRAQKFGNRTRNTIIFDRWVVQCQDDPSIEEVLDMFKKNELTLYSSYPPFIPSFISDSFFHSPKFSIHDHKELGALSEAIWMIYNKEDKFEIPKALNSLKKMSSYQSELTSYVSNCNKETKLDKNVMNKNINNYLNALDNLDITSNLKNNMKLMLSEVNELLDNMEKGDYKRTKEFVNNTKYLFRGATGVRHVDYIGYKNL